MPTTGRVAGFRIASIPWRKGEGGGRRGKKKKNEESRGLVSAPRRILNVVHPQERKGRGKGEGRGRHQISTVTLPISWRLVLTYILSSEKRKGKGEIRIGRMKTAAGQSPGTHLSRNRVWS